MLANAFGNAVLHLTGNCLSSSESFDIPLLSPLIPDEIPAGTLLLVEYDPQSQWFAIASTLVAKWLQARHRAMYVAMVRPREMLVRSLEKLGIDTVRSEEAGELRVDDWYSATLTPEQAGVDAVPVDGRYMRYSSVKVADLSVGFSRILKGGHQPLNAWSAEDQLGVLAIAESFSVLLRFNEEKHFLEWFENRDVPLQRKLRRISIPAFSRGLHSDSFYKRLENICDGVIDIQVRERDDEAKSYVRVQSLKEQPHDSRWHEVEVKANGEAVLVS